MAGSPKIVAALTAIGVLVLVLFRHAFSIPFFADDWSFLQLSQVESLGQWLAFFAPGKDYFYRPLSTEVFYWFLQLFPDPIMVGHLLVFVTFFKGLVLLMMIVRRLSGSVVFALLTTLIYATSFTHVFQLYWLATYQEVLMTTLLLGSFWVILSRRYRLALLLFGLALLSKETAIIFPLVVGLFWLIAPAYRPQRSQWWVPAAMLGMAGLLLGLSQSGVAANAQQQVEYQIQLAPGLMVNNLLWYLLWSLGLPQHLPDYLTSLFAPPIAAYQRFLDDPDYLRSLQLMAAYWLVTLISVGVLARYLIPHKRKYLCRMIPPWVVMALGTFGFFLLPFLPIVHRWMVRLTVPQIGIAILQAGILYLIYRLLVVPDGEPERETEGKRTREPHNEAKTEHNRKLMSTENRKLKSTTSAMASATAASDSQTGQPSLLRSAGRVLIAVSLVLYLTWNAAAVSVHEQISTYLLERQIYQQVAPMLNQRSAEIVTAGAVAFVEDQVPGGGQGGDESGDVGEGADASAIASAWFGSEKLQNSLSDQAFAAYFFPGESVQAFYIKAGEPVPAGAVVIPVSAVVAVN